MKRIYLLSIIMNIGFAAFAQDAQKTIDALTAKMNSVRDYSADVVIKAEIPMLRVLPAKATIYFKQKDKFNIVSKGIAIMPKQGFSDISKLLAKKESYTSLATGTEKIQNRLAEIVTILPSGDTSDFILAKLWIDAQENVMLKSQITSRSNGTMNIEYIYSSQKSLGLPESVVFTVDVKKFKIPKGVATDINRTKTVDDKKPVSKIGKIYLSFSNYVVNKGLRDEVFSKK
jgi:outer membrane lipoprotein-sorting protein